MKEFLKKNSLIILTFSLPVLLVVLVAMSSLIPSFLLSTQYDFVYATCGDGTYRFNYRCEDYLKNRFSVVNGKLVVSEVAKNQDSDGDGVLDADENYSARLFLHNTERNETREINLDKAQSFDLDSLLTSPDGVTLSSDYDRGESFFLVFDSGSSYGYYLTKGGSRSKLHLINSNEDSYYYNDNFKFIGWVLPGRN